VLFLLYSEQKVIKGKIEGQIEVRRRRGRRRKNLLDDLGDTRGYSHLKEEALDRIKWNLLEEAVDLSCDITDDDLSNVLIYLHSS
jgi:hypothetical protein